MTLSELKAKVDSKSYLEYPLSDWRPLLAKECQVYVCEEGYIAKRFDQINYKFCQKNEAKEVLIDNLYALLRFKYFSKLTEEVDERIQQIVNSVSNNLKTTLLRVSFDVDADCVKVSMLPTSCIAFRNGVFDFQKNDWLFKYDVIDLEAVSNKMYLYDPKYVILWYVNINFEPLELNPNETSLDDFIDIIKTTADETDNFCFKLMWNIAHDVHNVFDKKRFIHLCEILGYTVTPRFVSKFIMLIGSGGNGKNSLFDGCFISKIKPAAAANDLDAIENDRFITGALENRSHNFFLETSGKTYTDSKMIKALTGSMYQTIESKGVSKYSGILNTKFIFSANDQDKTKFEDNTPGFRRRANFFEIWYAWDAEKRFLKQGDYYDITYSDDFHEIKNNLVNYITYIYFGIYGLKIATNDFKDNFNFTENDWKMSYSSTDLDLKEKLDNIDLSMVLKYIDSGRNRKESFKVAMYDIDSKQRLYNAPCITDLGISSYEEFLAMLNDDEQSTAFFAEHDFYFCTKTLQDLCNDFRSGILFAQEIKKIYRLQSLTALTGNRSYVKCRIVKKKLMILNQ